MTFTDDHWTGTAPVDLRCQHPGCRFYAAGTYRGQRLCGGHLPAMPISCPSCEGSGETLTPGSPTTGPDVETRACLVCEGNGALTPGQYTAYTEYLAEN